MTSLLRRILSLGLLWRILVPVLVAAIIAIGGIQAWTLRHTRALIEARLTDSLDANLAMLQSDLTRLGNAWHLHGTRLLIGETPLNGRNDLVDRVAEIAGGVATIFAGDVRVATTVHTADGSRAVGTTLAPGPARSSALDRGETYRGTAMILGEEYVAIYQPLRDSAGKPVGILFVGLPTAQTRAVLANAGREALFATLTVIALLAALLAVLLRRSLAPLVVMTRAMHSLASGDLSVAIPTVRHDDEVAGMAKALDVFKQNAVENARMQGEREAERIRADAAKHAGLVAMAERVEAETTASVDSVSQQTQQMAVTAQQLAASAEHVGEDARMASDAANQALANSETVASAAQKLSASVREIALQVGRSTEMIDRAVRSGAAAQATIGALTDRVAQIGSVAGMISDIAAKTNLLALNATIEAARAGETGKGFAVVAGEVKALANQTARSTEEITQHISAVRSATDEAVRAVGEIGAGVSAISQIATAISGAVEAQRAATEEIARSVAQTSDAARTVAARVANVSAEAGQSGAQAHEVRESLGKLADAASALQHVVVRIVRSSTEDADRRRDPGTIVDLSGHITLAGRAGTQIVRIVELSAYGAALAGAATLIAGDRGALMIDGAAAPVTFAVRTAEDAVSGGRTHVAFDTDASLIVQSLLPAGGRMEDVRAA